MIPADIDPSLCTGEPTLDRLDDGFSPPAQDHDDPGEEAARPAQADTLGAKSLF